MVTILYSTATATGLPSIDLFVAAWMAAMQSSDGRIVVGLLVVALMALPAALLALWRDIVRTRRDLTARADTVDDSLQSLQREQADSERRIEQCIAKLGRDLGERIARLEGEIHR